MKKIISFIVCFVLIFASSMCVSAKYEEISSNEKEGTTPQWQVINTINITFYITGGQAYVSYLVTADVDNIDVSVQLQKQTLFWFDVGDEKTKIRVVLNTFQAHIPYLLILRGNTVLS